MLTPRALKNEIEKRYEIEQARVVGYSLNAEKTALVSSSLP
jgi:hypothetical protein